MADSLRGARMAGAAGPGVAREALTGLPGGAERVAATGATAAVVHGAPATEPAARTPGAASSPAAVLSLRGVTVRAGKRVLLRAIDLDVAPRRVLGVIGPSGAGKSTLLKTMNRLVDLETPPLAVDGQVRLHGRSIYDRSVDPDRLRARIGVLFQQPVVFPRSIYQNVAFGLRHVAPPPRRELPERVERALVQAALWDEVKDRLREPAGKLSVGQQQRLCLARTLAVEPEVILMDEPTSALDPRATAAIEGLILSLKARHTIVLVTHDPHQARRVTDRLACLCLRDGAGELVETAAPGGAFRDPQCCETLETLEREEDLVR